MNPLMKILKACVDKWGKKAQLLMVIEECAELIKAVAKADRRLTHRGEILDERVDVQLMLFQLDYIYGFTESEIEAVTIVKLNKLQRKLNDE